ncbi:hypothetical protein PFLUV_G00037930 [Perca fluviatilis]|uniref:Uncharacterized protein n=1 Tax=Perca fluviatilis TaxID=8168 RepID=A0A6A5EUR8_PERFL|nr:hypothetical protein PFLUV_G00037930 [Perca fluviatilis]
MEVDPPETIQSQDPDQEEPMDWEPAGTLSSASARTRSRTRRILRTGTKTRRNRWIVNETLSSPSASSCLCDQMSMSISVGETVTVALRIPADKTVNRGVGSSSHHRISCFPY